MNRHQLDVFSLGAGIAFFALAAAFVVGQWIDVSVNGALVFPLLLVLLGVLGVFAAIRAQRSNDEAVRSAAEGTDLRQNI